MTQLQKERQPMLDTRYTITFEIGSNDTSIDKANLHFLLGQYFDCYTLTVGDGCWKGTVNVCYSVDIVGDALAYPAIRLVARKIKERYSQEAVLVTMTSLQGELV